MNPMLEVTKLQNSDLKTVLQDESSQYSYYHKVAAFFLLFNEKYQDKISNHQEIADLFNSVKPQQLRNKLKKILNKMGGLNCMSEDKENLTVGFEIEYSNIPQDYEELLQFVMENIQNGWSHPRDASVEKIGDGYCGEATSPIIRTNQDLRSAMLNVALLEAMDAKVNESCGLHVHVGVKNIATPEPFKGVETNNQQEISPYQLEFIKQFSLIYLRENKELKKIERNYNRYSQAVKLTKEQIINAPDFQSLKNLVNKSD